MFNNCTSLLSVDFSNWNASQVYWMGYIFNNCTSLSYINFSNLNVSFIRNIYYIFNNCLSLISADFSNWNASYIYQLDHIFNNCTSLLSVNLSNWNVQNVSKMDYIFNNCTSLLSVNLSNWNISYINESNYMFSNIYSNFTYCIDDKISLKPIMDKLNSLSYAKRDCSSKCYLTPRRLNISTNKCDPTKCGKDDNNIYEYENLCYDICPKKTIISSQDEYICEHLSCERFYNFEQKGCLLEIPIGFYLENETSKTINKCNSNCSKCSKESMEYNLCEACNIDEEYYSKINNTLNIYPFIHCGKEGFEGYYLDNNDNIYKPCYSSCETCNEVGNETNHNCLSCKPGYYTLNDSFSHNNNCYENCSFYYYFDLENKYHCTLNDECPPNYNFSITNKSKCIDNCSKDDIYKYEFSSQCFEKCPQNTKISEEDPFKCEMIIPEVTELITYDIKIIDYLYSTINGNDPYESMINFKETEIITHGTKIIDYLNITINENEPDESVNNFKETLLSGEMNDTISDLIQGNQKSIVIENEEMKIELTTTDNKGGDESYNRTSIDLGECENKLKEHYNIDKNLSLLILKIDVSNKGFLIPKIEYEVYDPISMKVLNLSVCENTKIDLAIPVSINENKLFMYDTKSEFYNDICFTYTSENGTDISLKDRKKDSLDKNMTLCEENCDYKGYDSKAKKALCSCQVKIKLPLISEISFDKEILFTDFRNVSNLLNMEVMKCHKVLFNKEGIKNNIGALFVIPIILIHIASIIIFYSKGFDAIKKKINKIIDIKFNKSNINILKKENNNDLNLSPKNRENIKNDKDKKKDIKGKIDNKKQKIIVYNEKEEKFYNKNEEKIDEKQDNEIIVNKNIGKNIIEKGENYKNNDNKNSTAIKEENPNKKENNKSKAEKNKNENEVKRKRRNSPKLSSFKINSLINKVQSEFGELNNPAPPKNRKNNNQKLKETYFLKTNGEDSNSMSVRRINVKPLILNIKNTKNLSDDKKINEELNLKNEFIDLTDYEINLLEYKDALYIDKRTYSKYYISLLKTRHMIIFTFFSYHDYNSQIIKLSFFFFSITLFFTVNALFFNESALHRIKEDGGSFNIVYQLPQIVYSSLISLIINAIVKSICLTEKNIIQIKKIETKEEIKNKSKSILDCISKKIICYFILCFILLIFFWYYLSCFCAVYKNTQLHLFKDALISYGLSMLYPFLIYLIPGIFRIIALRTQKKDKENIYKFSKFLQLL